jgi:hypothetical protein
MSASSEPCLTRAMAGRGAPADDLPSRPGARVPPAAPPDKHRPVPFSCCPSPLERANMGMRIDVLSFRCLSIPLCCHLHSDGGSRGLYRRPEGQPGVRSRRGHSQADRCRHSRRRLVRCSLPRGSARARRAGARCRHGQSSALRVPVVPRARVIRALENDGFDVISALRSHDKLRRARTPSSCPARRGASALARC